MNGLALLQIVLALLSGILAAAIKSGLPQQIIASIQNAISELEQVHGSEVTKAQLEALRVTPQW
jgi:hypothetical protein